MIKPEWSKQLPFFEWMAMDARGEWFVFEEKPHRNDDAGGWWARRGEWDKAIVPKVGIASAPIDWRESLEERPPEPDNGPLTIMPPLFREKK